MDSLEEVPEEYISRVICGKRWYICLVCKVEVSEVETDIMWHIADKHRPLPAQTPDQPMPAVVMDTHQPWTSPAIDRSVFEVEIVPHFRTITQSGMYEYYTSRNDLIDNADNGRHFVDAEVNESVALDLSIEHSSDPLNVQPVVEKRDKPNAKRERTSAQKKKKPTARESGQLYACPHDGCQYECHLSMNLDRHVASVHSGSGGGGDGVVQPRFWCPYEGCDHSYITEQSLRSHVANHECGFGSDTVGPCHRSMLLKHRGQRVNKTGRVYWCKFIPRRGCGFRTRHSGSIMNHIHGQHVCPRRNDPSINGRTGRTALVSIPGPSGELSSRPTGGQTVGDTHSGGTTTAMRTGANAVTKTAVKKLSKPPAKKQKKKKKKRNVGPNRGLVAKSTTRRQRTAAGSVGRTDIRFNRPLSSGQRISMLRKELRNRAIRSAQQRRSPVPFISRIRSQPSAPDSNRTPNSTQTAHNSRNSLEMNGQRPPARPSEPNLNTDIEIIDLSDDEELPDSEAQVSRSAAPVVTNGVECEVRVPVENGDEGQRPPPVPSAEPNLSAALEAIETDEEWPSEEAQAYVCCLCCSAASLGANGGERRPPTDNRSDIDSDDEVVDEWRADACDEDRGMVRVWEWRTTPEGRRCICLKCAFPGYTVNEVIIHLKNTHILNA